MLWKRHKLWPYIKLTLFQPVQFARVDSSKHKIRNRCWQNCNVRRTNRRPAGHNNLPSHPPVNSYNNGLPMYVAQFAKLQFAVY